MDGSTVIFLGLDTIQVAAIVITPLLFALAIFIGLKAPS